MFECVTSILSFLVSFVAFSSLTHIFMGSLYPSQKGCQWHHFFSIIKNELRWLNKRFSHHSSTEYGCRPHFENMWDQPWAVLFYTLAFIFFWVFICSLFLFVCVFNTYHVFTWTFKKGNMKQKEIKFPDLIVFKSWFGLSKGELIALQWRLKFYSRGSF